MGADQNTLAAACDDGNVVIMAMTSLGQVSINPRTVEVPAHHPSMHVWCWFSTAMYKEMDIAMRTHINPARFEGIEHLR
jgi:hypothetical protein